MEVPKVVFDKTIKTEKPKRKKRKSKKVVEVEVTKTIKKVVIPEPKFIFEDEQKTRVMYCRKRMMFCHNPNKRLSYQKHIDKLMKRPVISFT